MNKTTILVLCALLCACSTTTIRFARVSNYNTVHADEIQDPPRVSGADCSATVFGGQVRDISAQHAFDHAVRHAYAELTDVVIRVEDQGTFIVGERCVRIEGYLEEHVEIP